MNSTFDNKLKINVKSYRYIHIVWVFIFTLTFIPSSYAQPLGLSNEEKEADFNYLYKELEASYPYFGINKRMNQVDWLANKEEYLQKIRKTESDRAFFSTLTGILNALNNGHTDTYPTVIYDYFYTAYKRASESYTSYIPYVQELEKTDTLRTAYWSQINSDLLPKQQLSSSETDESSTETLENIEVNFSDSLSIAHIHIKSFSYDFIENDAEKLKGFFDNAHNYKHLVIDIQGNGGGDTGYWMDHIIPYLISDTVSFSSTYAFKNSDRLKKFKPSYFEDTIPYDSLVLPSLPAELKNGSYLFRRSTTTISPISNPRKYSGKIYLLVDNVVFSSAETLAVFCKSTNFATVVGERTHGDGVGTDPLLLTLPNSGIVIRFTGEMGLNPDGSANEEEKTVPDLKIEASSNEERVSKLFNYIETKS